MKKILSLLAVAAAFTVTSCTTVAPLTATSNQVGSKCGVATETRILGFYPLAGDHGINKAAKEGGIKKISHVDVETFGVFPFYTKTTTQVYGE
ncbi:MAG: TRL-like family protein [Bacteroidaceae bacterium]|jgi:hypothetical protein|nr:TRL-like family protein [Bacteroidaceae bacterium]